jgi:hypothetical protein
LILPDERLKDDKEKIGETKDGLGIYSYKMHCRKTLPKDARIVCFHGLPKLTEVHEPWIAENWK